MSASNGTQTIQVSMQQEMADEFERRADSIHLLTDEYCSLVLTTWLASDNILELAER